MYPKTNTLPRDNFNLSGIPAVTATAPATVSRRSLFLLPALLLGNVRRGEAAILGQISPQKKEFIDPTTEFQVTRWTEESATARLPGELERAISRNNQQLLYASNRSGLWQPFLLNLPKGDSVQLAAANELSPDSLALLKDDKEFLYLDGATLVRAQIRRNRARDLYRAEDGWIPNGALRVSPDDRNVALLETRGAASRVMFVDLAAGKPRQVLESSQGLLQLLDFHPRYGLLLLDTRGTPVFHGGASSPAIPPFPPGEVLHARFSGSANQLIYLLHTTAPSERTQLMEFDVATKTHQLIANTSKFAVFSPNADSSVFVGASASLAQPLLLLLLRVTRREFSLMEHSASEPSVVRPIFTHDSQTIFFQSDRLGNNCIFSVSVKGLVEQT